MANPLASNVDPDQTPHHHVASDLGLHCFAHALLRHSRLEWVNGDFSFSDGNFLAYTRHEPVGVCGQIIPVSCSLVSRAHLYESVPSPPLPDITPTAIL